MRDDPTAEKVGRFARQQLDRSRERLEQAREDLAAVCREKERLEGRVVRLESEVAGWAERAGESG